jgi:hypothetical protein
MTVKNWPGAHHSDRARECVLRRIPFHTTGNPELQRRADPPCRIVGWRVSKWLAVEAVEAKHD